MRVDTETGLVFHRGLMVKSTIAIRLIQALAAVFGVIYLLLLVRFALTYIGANQSAGFSRFIWAATSTLYAPFRWLLHRGDDGAGHPIEWSLLVAVGAYAVAHGLLRRLVLAIGRP